MSEMTEEKKKMVKDVIKQLHAGVSPQEVKERFKRFLEDISSLEIAKIEQELIDIKFFSKFLKSLLQSWAEFKELKI
jgi:DUF438 domain-containing protein